MLARCTPTGLGDKVLDLIGAATLARLSGRTLAFVLCKEQPPAWWGNIGKHHLVAPACVELFDTFEGVPRPFTAITGTCGCSLHPFHIAEVCPAGVTTTEVVREFGRVASQVYASRHVMSLIPPAAAMSIGVHLRRGDKMNSGDARHGTTSEELEAIMQALRAHLLPRLPSYPVFVCSDDDACKAAFVAWVRGAGGRVVERDTVDDGDGLATVLDFFTLASCQEIHQGTAYSTFSMAAAIVGDVTLRNYHTRACWDPACFLNLWAPMVKLVGPAGIRVQFEGRIRRIGLHTHQQRADVRAWTLPSNHLTGHTAADAAVMSVPRRSTRESRPAQRYMDLDYDTDETDPDWDADASGASDGDDDTGSSLGDFLADGEDEEDETQLKLSRATAALTILTQGMQGQQEFIRRVLDGTVGVPVLKALEGKLPADALVTAMRA